MQGKRYESNGIAYLIMNTPNSVSFGKKNGLLLNLDIKKLIVNAIILYDFSKSNKYGDLENLIPLIKEACQLTV